MSHRSFRPRRRKLLFALGAAVCATTIPVNAAEVAFDIHIDNGRVPDNMRRLRVSQGDLVHLRFIADQPLTLHLHGYDIERQVARARSKR